VHVNFLAYFDIFLLYIFVLIQIFMLHAIHPIYLMLLYLIFVSVLIKMYGTNYSAPYCPMFSIHPYVSVLGLIISLVGWVINLVTSYSCTIIF